MVNNALTDKRRVLAVGGSVLRTLESSVSSSGTLNPAKGWTDKFITPPYDFNIPNCFLTNFHEPASPLFMLSAAYAGYDFIKEVYREAFEQQYRFLCYGDALLIL
jgi:S-adenosylmethionine:tRNA ribosyltransferase-isomerase